MVKYKTYFTMDGFHHLRARALIKRGLEPFPARTAWKRFLDYVMYGVGIFAPLALVPQILKVYETESSSGLSLPTWILLMSFNILWALYGAVHKEKQLFLASGLMSLFDCVIIIGILLY